VRSAGVGERLGHQRHESGTTAHQRHRGLDQRLVEADYGAGAAEQGEQLLFGTLGRKAARRVAEHPLVHLRGDVGDEAVHRQVRVGGLDAAGGRGGEDRRDRGRAAADLGGHLLELRRLVAEHHHVGALGQLGVGRHGLAAQLVGEGAGAGRVQVVHQHRLAHAAGERRSHVPCSDQPEPHRRCSLLAWPRPTGRASGLVEEALLDQPRALLG
jgi:hypothetical protein